MRPSVAFATIQLLEQAGWEVDVPPNQTCCGQPGYNSGDIDSGITLAKQFIEQFEDAQYIVAPSGSCVGMVCHHYPRILEGEWRQRALAVAQKTYELTTFLTEVAKLTLATPNIDSLPTMTYHDSCAGLRELRIKQQPRELLKNLCDVDIVEMHHTDACCGFGGTFCAKMPEISAKMTDDKISDAMATGAHMLTGGDLGCLLTIAGRAKRLGQDLEVRHIAEILSGDLSSPPIGDPER